MDAPLWEIPNVTASVPRHQLYGANVDLGNFPLLCEVTYAELARKDPRIRRQMPFCAYQHVMNGYLQGALINQTIDNNLGLLPGEITPRELIPEDQVVMPEAIAIYLEGITNTRTPTGDEVRFNLPTIGMPQLAIPADGIHPEIGPGSFGVVNRFTHNAYEAYVAPIVTSGLIRATVAANGPNPPRDVWQPLPEGAYPVDGVPNRNLLGWREPELLGPEALNVIHDIRFGTEGLQGRLCYSSELVLRVTGILLEKEKDHKIRKGWPGGVPRSPDLSFVTTEQSEPGAELSRAMVTVRSPFELTAGAVARQFLTVQRRERTPRAAGCCYLLDGEDPENWVETRNRNFEMDIIGGYSPIGCLDMPSLRVWRHNAVVPRESRDQVLAAWIRSRFVNG
jgi:hypothetical protein